MTRPAGSATAIALLVLMASLRPDSGLAQTSDDQTPAESTPVAASPAALSFPWPNQFNEGGQAFTVYPPQLDRWQGDRLEGQAAVAVQPAGAEKPVFGVVWLSARTEVDSASGMVKVGDIAASRARFPTATANAGPYLDVIRRHLSAVTWTVARDRLESELAIEHASRDVQSQPLRNAPPRILYSELPAILVPIDGPPQLKEMAGLDLLRVVNTRALILQDKTTRRYYLFVADHWMEAPAIEGPWSEAYVRPSALEEAKQQALENDQVELVEEGEAAAGRVPVVYVTTAPAELVQTDGPPQYLPIQGTNLLYVTNTPNRLFLDLQTQKYYLLLSGRWYRTASLSQGTWEYVPGTSLPADFAMIPSEHPTESVRASVPGTPQAQEAVIANSVPQVAAVKRSAATLEITYDGSPQFRPIEGTPLQYAVNSPVPVIEVDQSSFYALDNGVWFVSNSPFGSWTVATWVPPVIYSIPRSSPLHYVTYVRVYEATPEVVYEGYTPGYVGSYVAPSATVVYGTGWYYQPWVGTVWYGPPVTWGFGFSVVNTWWSPWPWRPWWWAGWAPVPCFRPWWGPWIAPVVVAPVFVPRGVPVVVGHGVAPINRVTVNNIRANNGTVAHIFQRWGGRVATPIGAPPRFASTGNGTHPTGVWSPRANWRGAGPPLAQGATGQRNFGPPVRQGATGPRNSGPPVANESQGFSGGPARPSGTTAAATASAAAGAAGRPIPGAASAPSQNLQGFRRMDGQWQRFQGNGQWQNMNAPNPNAPRGITRSPPMAQGGGPRAGTPGGAPVVSGVPMRGGPAGSTASQSMPPSAPQFATGAQGNRWSGPTAPHSAAPIAPGRPAEMQTHSFVPRGVRFGQGGGGEAPPMGRSGGAWVPNHGGADMAGGNNAAGRLAPAGGQGRGLRGGGGGGRMGGPAMR
jgi:hypothetical protein